VTACVIASDEEERLPACLESLSFCEEVVVVDGGSRDRTVEIARAAGARVVENPWPGFAAQRNVALDRASGDWVLEIDADERVSPELAAEIRAMLAGPPPRERMAAIPMRDVFLGRPLGPSVRYPRYRHRLFRRGAFRHDESRAVHEGLWPDGPTVPLSGELTHLLASSWGEALRDARAYARLEAAQRSRPGPGEALVGIALRPAAKLAYRVLLYGAWRDGWRGLAKVCLECGADSLATFHRLRGATEGAEDGFGQRPPRLGPARLVGLALGDAGAARLTRWLGEAAEAGADVALISDRPAAGREVRCRTIGRATPGAFLRALDAEDQVRPIDALVPAGRRERLLLRLAPGSLRGATEPVDPGGDRAAAAAHAVRTATRPAETT
jgi:glycosyl transferase family 2